MGSKELRLLARLNAYEGIVESLKILYANPVMVPARDRISKLLESAEADLAQEKLDWNTFILKERT